MRPSSSKPQNNRSLQSIDDQLTEQIKKLTLLQGDQLQFRKQAEDTQAKNQGWIDKLRQQNRKFKKQRDDIICKKRVNTTTQSRISLNTSMPEVHSQSFWRRELDKQKYVTKTLKNTLTTLQDKLRDVQSNKISYIQQSPLMRTIRILQNRLDKVMIKYNEANSMRESYQQVVKRLQQQRIGYDNQITAIERSLKGKESDFEELRLLAHDASHAREQAQSELKKYEHKRSAIKDLREQYVREKKGAVQVERLGGEGGSVQGSAIGRERVREKGRGEGEGEGEGDEGEELESYEQAFKKLKEVTGVNDANEIIQKFKTQGMTTKSLDELRERYKGVIENLRIQKEEIKEHLNKVKYEGTITIPQKRKADECEAMLDKMVSQGERVKAKYEKTSKMLVNVKVAIEHLATYIEFMRSQPIPEDITTEDLLIQINGFLQLCYSKVKKDPNFKSQTFKQTTSVIEKYIQKGGDVTGPVNTNLTRIIKHEGQDSGNEFEEEIDEAVNERIKHRNLQPTIKQVFGRNFRKFKA